MAKIRATIQAQRELKINQTPFVTRKLGDLADVDLSNVEDGSILVFNAQTEKLTATRLLNNQFIEGGQF